MSRARDTAGIIQYNHLTIDDANDRVGIGQSSPASELHVVGNNIVQYVEATGTAAEICFRNNTSTGDNIRIGGSGNNLTFDTGGTEAYRVDSSRRILLGHTSSRAIGHSSGDGKLQIEGTNLGTSELSIVRNSDNNGAAHIFIGKSRGSSVGDSTVVQDDDTLGIIGFAGADGTDLQTRAAQIECAVDGTPGSNDMPGRLTFHTTADGAASPTERLRITSAGDFGYGTDSPGCFFEISKDDSGATVQQKLLNRSTDANSSSNNFIYVNGAAAGDPFTTWTVGGVTSWSMGIDNSDSDKLVINNGSNLNSNLISVDINGNVTVNETITADGYEGNLELDVFLFG